MNNRDLLGGIIPEMGVLTKWMRVLKKCKEIPEDSWGSFAQLLENQYTFLDRQRDPAKYDVADFTRFTLPVIRKLFSKLIEIGFEIQILESMKNTKALPITVTKIQSTISDLNIQDCSALCKVSELVDYIVDEMSESLIEAFPDKILKSYVFMVPTGTILNVNKDTEYALIMQVADEMHSV